MENIELRNRIIRESSKLFMKLGVRNATMDDIALLLGISKKTVYEVFENKTELVVSCLRHMMIEREHLFLEVTASAKNVIEEMIILMNKGIKAINAINPVFFCDVKKYYPNIWQELYDETQKRHRKLTYDRLQRGIAEGFFRNNIDVEIVTILFQAQMDILSNEAVFPPGQYDFADLFRNLIVNFVRGISTKKGIALVDTMMDEQALR